MFATTYMTSWQHFDYITLAIQPMFLFSATFFPLSTYPESLQWVVRATPLYHGVALERGLMLGEVGWGLLVNVAYLAGARRRRHPRRLATDRAAAPDLTDPRQGLDAAGAAGGHWTDERAVRAPARGPPIPALPGYVTDGGLETDLIFHHGVDLPEFAAFPLVDDAGGPRAARRLLVGLRRDRRGGRGRPVPGDPDLAGEPRLGRPARRRRRRAGRGQPRGRAPARRAGATRTPATCPRSWWSGCVGPRGDGYVAGEAIDPDEARRLPPAAGAGVRRRRAPTWSPPYPDTGRRGGRASSSPPARGAPGGGGVHGRDRRPAAGRHDAARRRRGVDGRRAPDWFVVNCAHPSHVAAGLADAGPWLERVGGTRVNASDAQPRRARRRGGARRGRPRGARPRPGRARRVAPGPARGRRLLRHRRPARRGDVGCAGATTVDTPGVSRAVLEVEHVFGLGSSTGGVHRPHSSTGRRQPVTAVGAAT